MNNCIRIGDMKRKPPNHNLFYIMFHRIINKLQLYGYFDNYTRNYNSEIGSGQTYRYMHPLNMKKVFKSMHRITVFCDLTWLFGTRN
jgi:hypothetical protein